MANEKESKEEKEIKTIGLQIIEDLGLTGFKHVYLQKAINTTYHIYLITVDSKHPAQTIKQKLFKNGAKTTQFKKVRKTKPIIMSFVPMVMQNTLFTDPLKFSPPQDLYKFNEIFQTGGIIMFRDLVGESYVKEY
jgi:hypothetical protein